jgi:hypothetical protein
MTARRDDLADLIARLEAAPEGSRELSDTVAVAAGWNHQPNVTHNFHWRSPEGYSRPDRPAYTTSLDAKLPDEEIVEVKRMADGTWIAVAMGTDDEYESEAYTEPLARRAAALKARAAGSTVIEGG